MSEKEKKKQLHEKQDYAQEDWYKSNRTPEGLKQYEFGQDMHTSTEESSHNLVDKKKRQVNQDLDQFEFGQDNYFSTNGALNTATGKVQMNQEDVESINRLSNMAEHNHYPDEFDVEFGVDYMDFNEQVNKNKKD